MKSRQWYRIINLNHNKNLFRILLWFFTIFLSILVILFYISKLFKKPKHKD